MIPIIDAHSQADQYVELEEIIKLMDRAGDSRTILEARGKLKWQQLVAFAARYPTHITAAVSLPDTHRYGRASAGLSSSGSMSTRADRDLSVY